MPRGIYKHKPNTVKQNKNIGKALKGKKKPLGFGVGRKITWTSGKNHKPEKHSEETKKKIREWCIKHPNKKFRDTSIELKVEAELKRRGINYQKQIPLCKIAIVDFYLPEYKIVIQCDGCYYHGCPMHNPTWIKNKERDRNQDRVLTFNGFNIYRFWGHEINESVKKCINTIKVEVTKG